MVNNFLSLYAWFINTNQAADPGSSVHLRGLNIYRHLPSIATHRRYTSATSIDQRFFMLASALPLSIQEHTTIQFEGCPLSVGDGRVSDGAPFAFSPLPDKET